MVSARIDWNLRLLDGHAVSVEIIIISKHSNDTSLYRNVAKTYSYSEIALPTLPAGLRRVSHGIGGGRTNQHRQGHVNRCICSQRWLSDSIFAPVESHRAAQERLRSSLQPASSTPAFHHVEPATLRHAVSLLVSRQSQDSRQHGADRSLDP